MKGQEVTIYKLADILRTSLNPTIMLISDGDEIISYYVSLFLENKKLLDDSSILKASSGVVSQPFTVLRNGPFRNPKSKLSGIADDYPKSGQIFAINNSSWHTSKVDLVIEGCILVTRNSIYALHNQSFIRDKKLKQIGI